MPMDMFARWRKPLVPPVLIICAVLAGLSCFFNPDRLEANEPSDLGEYEVIVENDLFVPDRKKPEETAGTDEKKAAVGDEIKQRCRVYGTMKIDSVYRAYIKLVDVKKKRPARSGKKTDNEKGKLRAVSVGDQIEGWTVTDITEKGMELTLGDDRVVLRVFDREKSERKATGPVALQTPQPKVETPPPVGRPPAKAAPRRTGGTVSGKPGGKQGTTPRRVAPSGAQTPPPDTGIAAPPAVPNSRQPPPVNLQPGAKTPETNPFLELLRRSKSRD